jgi:hypothetical protein
VLAVVAATAVAPVAAQQPSGEARARSLFELGVAAAAEERWDEAVALFRSSLEIAERPATAYNLAVALDRLALVREALAALETYFRLAGPADSRRDNAEALRRELGGRIASLRIEVEPPEALVEIDGEPQPGSGRRREIAIDPGEHVVRVAAEGHATRRIRIDVVAGTTIERTVELEVDPTGGDGEADDDGGLGTTGAIGVVLATAGGATLVASLVTGLRSNAIYHDLADRCGPSGRSCPVGSESDIDSGLSLARASTVLMAIGGAAALAGIILIVIEAADGGDVELSLGPTGGSARIGF